LFNEDNFFIGGFKTKDLIVLFIFTLVI